MSKQKESLRTHVLILRCQAGDEHAFTDLFGQFGDRTFRYLRGLLDAESAGDVQQEVWLTVYQKISMLSNPRGFRTWLFQITRHKAIDYLRREKRYADRFGNLDEDVLDAPATGAVEPDAPLLGNEIGQAMDRLTAMHRDVLILQFWEEMNYAEIALVTGCSIGTVRSRIHHAKTKIRKELVDMNT